MAEIPKPAPKRIIICCDGTWQSAVSGERNSPSNVTRLARCLNHVAVEKNKTWQQIVWYDSGVGTASNWLVNKMEGAVGAGLEGNIVEAYNFVVLNYNPGDQILCFGFSRGAFTARAIAGLISDIGICEARKLHEFHDVWELYKKNNTGERFHGSDAWFDYLDGTPADDKDQPDDLGYRNSKFVWKKPPQGDWAVTAESREIELVGVFDTVGALGLPEIQGVRLGWGPDTHAFHNVKLNPNIKNAFQALGLDEHREHFSPMLWYLPEQKEITTEQLESQQKQIDDTLAAWYPKAYDKKVPLGERQELKKAYNEARRALHRLEEHRKLPSELLQVWFPGVHINIGGGSSAWLQNKGDLEGMLKILANRDGTLTRREMANITFSWMLDQISPYVSINENTVWQETRARQNHIDELNEQLRKYKEQEDKDTEEAAKSWGRWATRVLGSAASTVMQPLIKTTKPNTDRHDFGWGTGTIIDSFGFMSRLNGSKPRTPGNYKDDHKYPTPGETNEQVHPTVGYRYRMLKRLPEKMQYRPAGIKKGEYKRRKNGTGHWEYVFSKATLLEYKMKPSQANCAPTFERNNLSLGCLALEKTCPYVQRLDRVNGYPHEWHSHGADVEKDDMDEDEEDEEDEE